MVTFANIEEKLLNLQGQKSTYNIVLWLFHSPIELHTQAIRF